MRHNLISISMLILFVFSLLGCSEEAVVKDDLKVWMENRRIATTNSVTPHLCIQNLGEVKIIESIIINKGNCITPSIDPNNFNYSLPIEIQYGDAKYFQMQLCNVIEVEIITGNNESYVYKF